MIGPGDSTGWSVGAIWGESGGPRNGAGAFHSRGFLGR